MFQNLFNMALDYGHITLGQIRLARSRLLMAVMMALVLVMVMLGINLAGYKTWNAILFLIGSVIIAARVTVPVVLGTAGAAGGAVAYLGDRDVSQGVLEGFKFLYKLTIGVLAGFWIVAGLLATWSFKESPLAFFMIMACSIGIMVVMSAYGIKSGKKTAYAVIGYTAIIMATAFWQTLTPSQKDILPVDISGIGSGQNEVELAEADPIQRPANFLNQPEGAEIVIRNFRPNQEILVLMPTAYQHILGKSHPEIPGVKVYAVCARITRPKLPADVVVLFLTDRGDNTNSQIIMMTDASRVMLIEKGYGGIAFDVTLRLIVREQNKPNCANTGT